ncbi:MAG: helix-turn-helix transcriptional regulator [Verrucomicrobiota bacterium]
MPRKKKPVKDLVAVKLGQTISERRRVRKLSQERLAELAELSRAYMGCVERGEFNASLPALYRIAKALKWTMADMFLHADL